MSSTLPQILRLPSDADSSGRDFGAEEMALLAETIASGTLNCTRGTQVNTLQKEFAERCSFASVRAVTSGTAAIHCALAALNFEPGDEVITSPITDMGAITPILYQGGVPVFADTCPVTLNVTRATVEARLSPRTRAIVVTHLFGQPADVESLAALARDKGIALIEDCAQAYDATAGGRMVGHFGDIACFSLQQGKHMSCGEGGLVATNNAQFARRIALFSDKAWGYGDPQPDHYFLALNYRMTELQGAVSRAQLKKLSGVVERRQRSAARLSSLLRGTPGLTLPEPLPGTTHVYWKYPLIVDPAIVRGGADALGKELAARGVSCAPRYIKKPAFDCAVIRDRQTLGSSQWPWSLRPEIEREKAEDFPGTYQGLSQILVLPWNERYQDEHVEYIHAVVREALALLC